MKNKNRELIKFDNIEEIMDYTNIIKGELINLKNQENKKLLYDYSEFLPTIDYEHLPKITEDDLKLLKKEFLEIRLLVSDCNDSPVSYNVSKYFRTFYDMLYNTNTTFDVLISIIIPTYNVEDYIDDCLTSLLEQNLEDIEVICVDDCSTDATVDILRYYQQKDKRVKCYVMNEKNGSGGCRNFALTKAKGKYIQYLDSDDFMDLNALKELYELAENKKTQILMYKATCYVNDEDRFIMDAYFEMTSLTAYLNHLYGIEDYDKRDLFKVAVIPWNKLYLRSFLNDLDVKFPKNIIHQDNPFFFESFVNADRIYFIENHYYNRRIRSNSITNLKDETELGVIDIIEMILNVFIKYGLYEKYKVNLLNRLFEKFKYRYTFIKEEYRGEYYKLAKMKIEKFANHYDLYDDLNTQLYPGNRIVFEKYMSSTNHTEFSELYK